MTFTGYFQIPRSLSRDPLWLNLPPTYKQVFLTILDYCVFKPTKFDDHGIVLDLKPGQLCVSERELKKLCGKGISRNDIQRSLDKFFLYGFSSQKVIHKKTVITITHKETYDLIFKASEPRSEPILSQTRANLEPESNNDKNIRKEKITKRKAPLFPADSVEYGLSIFLLDQIRIFLPKLPDPNMQQWSQVFRYMLNLDKRTAEEIKKTILWLNGDGFWWQRAIQCAESLRKNWNKITVQMNHDKIPIQQQKKISLKEKVLKKFTHGQMINNAEIFIDDEGFAIQRGMTHMQVKYKDHGAEEQISNMLRKFGIEGSLNSQGSGKAA